MADVANGTQFSDLPSCLVIDILLRLSIKALLICRYVRKDWTQLYFSDPYFISRQLETSNIQLLNQNLTKERKFRFGWFVDEVSAGNLKMETLDFSCNLPHDPEYDGWHVVNSCNGLLCLRPHYASDSSLYVCNPILGEWVCIPVPNRCFCALGFSAKNNQYKILSCVEIMYPSKYEWEIYTLGTGQWRSIETDETIHLWYGYGGINFNTFIHGSLHWIDYSNGERWGEFVASFDFETERFTLFPLPKLQNPNKEVEFELQLEYTSNTFVALSVINGCLWASFYNAMKYTHEEIGYFDNNPSYQNITHYHDGEMWAMKEYGDEKSWTMMLAMRNNHTDVYDTPDEVLLARHNELVILKQSISIHKLLYTLNEDEMLIFDARLHKVFGYNSKTKMRSREMMVPEESLCYDVTAYNPSFVSLPEFERGEQVIRGRERPLRRIDQEETKEEDEGEIEEEYKECF